MICFERGKMWYTQNALCMFAFYEKRGGFAMEKRQLGKTGEMLSIIGFGGIITMDEVQQDANKFVDEAIDRGVNYFDVAPSYGNAESKLGPALSGKRKSVFLACKTEMRTAAQAEAALHNSFKLLQTDWFDLYQLHGVTTVEEVETICGPGGALETFVKAREQGLVRYLGFSAHSEEAAVALLDRFSFDSVLFPVNWASHLGNGFGEQIIKKAEEKGAARLALKAMAKSTWPEGAEKVYSKAWYEPIPEKEHAQLALRYTLSQPVTAAVPPGHIQLFRWALDAADDFRPVTPEEIAILKYKSREIKPLFPLNQ